MSAINIPIYTLLQTIYRITYQHINHFLPFCFVFWSLQIFLVWFLFLTFSLHFCHLACSSEELDEKEGLTLFKCWGVLNGIGVRCIVCTMQIVTGSHLFDRFQLGRPQGPGTSQARTNDFCWTIYVEKRG